MMEIRELEETDNPKFRKTWIEALTKQEKYFRTSIDDDLKPNIPTYFSKDSFTLGAFSNNDLVGLLSVTRDIKVKLSHKALLFGMYVSPSVAGKGLGKQLLDEAILRAKSNNNIHQLYLTVLTSNTRAINLYSSAGFEVFATEPKSVNIQGQYLDEYQMVLFV